MEKEFVPYEQALALKELGFDEPCCANMFDYTKSHINSDTPNRIRYYYPDFPKNFNEKYEPIHLIDTDIFVSIPLYQQAFTWFRKKYDTSSFVKRDFKDTKMIGYYYGIEGTKNDEYSKTYDSYEEAELECLIKLIELCKNN